MLRVPAEVLGAVGHKRTYIVYIFMYVSVILKLLPVGDEMLDVPAERLFVLREERPENTRKEVRNELYQ